MIKFLDCKPYKKKKISLVGCDLIISEGSNELEKVSLCDLSYPLLDCGGYVKRKYIIPPNSSKEIHAGNIAQEQGEVAFIAIKVTYSSSETANKVINFEYKGEIYPIYNIMILSGITKPNEPYKGWDMTPYSENVPLPIYSPELNPVITSPNFTFGGFLINNPLSTDVQIEIYMVN